MAITSGNSYRDLRASIQREKDQRVLEHQANIAKSGRMAFSMAAGQKSVLNLIAQGDSWFDYPLPFPTHTDVVAHLKNLPSMHPEVLCLAHHGESAEDMLGVTKLHELVDNLNKPANGKFDAILFSGGGNDLVGNQFRLWLGMLCATPIKARA